MSDTHNKDSTGRGQPNMALDQEQEKFARLIENQGIASYEDVVRAYQTNDTASIQKWQQQSGSTSTQREKASPGT